MRFESPAQQLKKLNEAEEGPYHRYLESLSPDFDHLLAYSRYSYFKRGEASFCDTLHNVPNIFSSVYVVDILKTGEVLEPQQYYGATVESMNDLHEFLSKEPKHDLQLRIIYTPLLTNNSIETLGSVLSLDPNVFSRHIGTSFKHSGADVAQCGSCQSYARFHSFYGYRPFGYITGANTGYGNDNSIYDSLIHSVYSTEAHPTTVSIAIPRAAHAGRLSKRMFQEPPLFYGSADMPIASKLEYLQHATIHLQDESSTKGYRQVVVLSPLSPGAKTAPRLDPVSGKKVTKSFNEFLHEEDVNEQVVQRDTMVNAIVDLAKAKGFMPGDIAHLVQLHALHEWFDLIQRLEDRLDNITMNVSLALDCQPMQQDLLFLDTAKGVNLLTGEEGLKNAILHYMAALDEEIERLQLDMDADHGALSRLAATAKKYSYTRRRMGHLLFRVQHSLDDKNNRATLDLTNIQIRESRKSIQQAQSVKRLTTLAFIYIPLSFVTSALGMNVRELEPGPSIWVFAVAAAVMAVVTVAAAVLSAHLATVCRVTGHLTKLIWYQCYNVISVQYRR